MCLTMEVYPSSLFLSRIFVASDVEPGLSCFRRDGGDVRGQRDLFAGFKEKRGLLGYKLEFFPSMIVALQQIP